MLFRAQLQWSIIYQYLLLNKYIYKVLYCDKVCTFGIEVIEIFPYVNGFS